MVILLHRFGWLFYFRQMSSIFEVPTKCEFCIIPIMNILVYEIVAQRSYFDHHSNRNLKSSKFKFKMSIAQVVVELQRG